MRTCVELNFVRRRSSSVLHGTWKKNMEWLHAGRTLLSHTHNMLRDTFSFFFPWAQCITAGPYYWTLKVQSLTPIEIRSKSCLQPPELNFVPILCRSLHKELLYFHTYVELNFVLERARTKNPFSKEGGKSKKNVE